MRYVFLAVGLALLALAAGQVYSFTAHGISQPYDLILAGATAVCACAGGAFIAVGLRWMMPDFKFYKIRPR